MKRVLYIIALAVSLASCSKNSGNGNAPEVNNPPHNIITARIADYGTAHIWTEGDLFGLYGSISGENVRYVVEPVSYEKDGAARIYGSGADGDVYGYYPYNEEDGCPAAAIGRQPLSTKQDYFSNARNQLLGNSVLVAKLDEETLAFSWLCGILHIHVTAGVDGNVQTASLISDDAPLCGDYSVIGEEPLLSNPAESVTLEGLNNLCGPDAPLDLYFMLPPGVYTSLFLTLASDKESITKPIELTVTISSMSEINCTVSDKETVYDGTDIIIIDGEFDI